ncbi:hypothetical protein P5P81_00835 [Tritonibacter mobilis]|nr:hypothetical protein [Tritonibacter mobilis]
MKEELMAFLLDLKSENAPIELDLKGTVQYIHFGNSAILKKLKYYPIAIALILFLLIGVIYFFFTTSKASEQNKLMGRDGQRDRPSNRHTAIFTRGME